MSAFFNPEGKYKILRGKYENFKKSDCGLFD